MSYTVLVAAGHPQLREALAARLRRVPEITAVLAAAGLEEAIACVEQHAPRVVLCDPTTLGDASTAVQRLAGAGIPVVALVASIDVAAAEGLRRAGARVVLLQGITTATLLRHLADAVAAHDGHLERLEVPRPEHRP